MQNATSEDGYMWGIAYNDDRISKKKDLKKIKLKKIFFFFFLIKKKGGVRLLEHVR